jgi:hypothetical protein
VYVAHGDDALAGALAGRGGHHGHEEDDERETALTHDFAGPVSL